MSLQVFHLYIDSKNVLEISLLDASGNPYNLSGFVGTIQFQIFAEDVDIFSNVQPLFTKSIGNGLEITDSANGIIQVTWSPYEVTQAVDYQFRLKVDFGGGDVWYPIRGILKFKPQKLSE